MRILPLLLLLASAACGSIDPSTLRARDLAWLTGSWHGADARGIEVELVFDPPADGAMQGELHAFQGGEAIVRSSMRIVSGTNGVVLLGTLEGSPARNYGLVEAAPRFVRFRARQPDYPGEVTFSRTAGTLTMTIRGTSGLNIVREVVQELRLTD